MRKRIGWWFADAGGGIDWSVSISGRYMRVLGRGISEVRRWVDDLWCG